jgi:vacuolar protein sorting-associated protein 13A/C
VYEEQIIWVSSDAYPWGCYIYQIQSASLQFMALRVPKEKSELRPKKMLESSFVQRASETPCEDTYAPFDYISIALLQKLRHICSF